MLAEADMTELNDELKRALIETAESLGGADRRLFMARVVRSFGRGGQRKAETELGWNRVTLRKGMAELASGITCCDAFCLRGRLRAERRLPNLLADVKDLVTSQSQADPRFRTLRLYTRLTAEEVRRQLTEDRARLPCDQKACEMHRARITELDRRLAEVERKLQK